MGKAETYLIPGRFTLTLGHLLAVMIMYSHLDDNVASSLSSNPTADMTSEALSDLKMAWTIAIVCFVFDFVGLFGGLSIFFRRINLLHCILHFFGAIYTSWFIVHAWNAKAFWQICGLFNILPALVEASVMLNIFVFKAMPY